jgi:DNA-binding CsgD family transcriptional regulator
MTAEHAYIQIGERAEWLYTIEELTTDRIAEILHCSRSTVCAALRHRDVPMRPQGKHGRVYIPSSELHAVATLYRRGLTTDEIAKAMGFKSHVSVLKRLRLAGVESRRPGGRKLKPSERVAQRSA